MEDVRESWTDERLDDMSRRMELGFTELKTELRREIGSVREAIAAMDDRLHGMQRTTVQFQGVLIAALVGLIATQL
jgi:hypothetical protein